MWNYQSVRSMAGGWVNQFRYHERTLCVIASHVTYHMHLSRMRLQSFEYTDSYVSVIRCSYNLIGDDNDNLYIYIYIWLVVTGTWLDYFPRTIGNEKSSQMTNSYFSEGWLNHQPVMFHIKCTSYFTWSYTYELVLNQLDMHARYVHVIWCTSNRASYLISHHISNHVSCQRQNIMSCIIPDTNRYHIIMKHDE